MTHSKQAQTPPLVSPTLSTLSSLSSMEGSPPDLRIQSRRYSPHTVTPVVSKIKAKESVLLSSPVKIRKERQTRISEHLRSVKPGSLSPSTSSIKNQQTRGTSETILTPTPKAPATKPAASLHKVHKNIPGELSRKVQDRKYSSLKASTMQRSEEDLDVIAMEEEEVKARLHHQKLELMERLAQHGIKPQADVLDHALRTMTEDGIPKQDMTVESFLSTLKVLDPNVTPISRSTSSVRVYPESRSATASPPKAANLSMSFSVLESPSSPGLSSPTQGLQATASASLPTPPSRTRSSGRTVRKVGQPMQLPALELGSAVSSEAPGAAASSAGLHSSPVMGTPSDLRNGRLNAFSLRRSRSEVVAAKVKGMGRIAMSRYALLDLLGPDIAERAIVSGSVSTIDDSAIPPLTFGLSQPRSESPAFLLFGGLTDGRSSHTSAVTTTTALSPVVDERLGLVKAWLEGTPDDTSEDEDSRKTWSTIPREWDAELDQYEMEHQRVLLEKEIKYVDVEPEVIETPRPAETEVVQRVGGKSVRVLLRAKRRRVEEDDEEHRLNNEFGLTTATEVPDGSSTDPNGTTGSSTTPKRSRDVTTSADEIDCLCDRKEDTDEAMVQCDECRSWLHLSCLDIPSAKSLPKKWYCFRCVAVDAHNSSNKRLRLVVPSTPTLRREPTLVATAFSPRPKGNFYRNSAPDMALAPSPKSSPSRRYAAPPSPVSAIPTPVTPQLGQSRADYSPRSPLFYRTGRVRMHSGAYDDTRLQGGWVSGWDGHMFGVSHPDEFVPTPIDDEDYHPNPSWHDMNMTPSRSLHTSDVGHSWPEGGGLQTPSTSNSRPVTVPMTPSQDFLSALHHDSPTRAHDGNGMSFAQRLFASPSAHAHTAHYNTTGAPSQHSSPLGKGRYGHKRAPSFSNQMLHQAASPRQFYSNTSGTVGGSPYVGSSKRTSYSKGATYHFQGPVQGELQPHHRQSSGPYQPQHHSKLYQQQCQSPVTPPTAHFSSMARSNSGLGIGLDGGRLEGQSPLY